MLTAGDTILIFGAAGLVGQNLVVLLKQAGLHRLVCIDKHPANTATLRRLHPELTIVESDMADSGAWQEACAGATAAVMLQAQIGGDVVEAFERNNIIATRNALDALARHGVSYLVHVSSSVVNSAAADWYIESKREQEAMVNSSTIAHCVLRPTLMFGPFDRKHLGWLSRFMQRAPIFPIPGDGSYIRQPLYVADFCRIVLACLNGSQTGSYDITGRERINYVDIIRAIRHASGARARIVRIPYWLFWTLLKFYAAINSDPPFTTKQLRALATPDEFALIPWCDIFGTDATPFARAVQETYGAGASNAVVLDF